MPEISIRFLRMYLRDRGNSRNSIRRNHTAPADVPIHHSAGSRATCILQPRSCLHLILLSRLHFGSLPKALLESHRIISKKMLRSAYAGQYQNVNQFPHVESPVLRIISRSCRSEKVTATVFFWSHMPTSQYGRPATVVR